MSDKQNEKQDKKNTFRTRAHKGKGKSRMPYNKGTRKSGVHKGEEKLQRKLTLKNNLHEASQSSSHNNSVALVEDVTKAEVKHDPDNFFARRDFILRKKNPPSVSDIKKKFPSFFQKDEIFLELEYIFKKRNLLETFSFNVKIYYANIWTFSNSPLKAKIESFIQTADKFVDKKWIRQAASLLLLPEFLQDDRKSMILFDREILHYDHERFPYIKCHGNFEHCLKKDSSLTICVEDVEVCSVSDIIQAVFGLIAVYYVFNIVYPPKIENTLLHLEKLYLNYNGNSCDLDNKVLNIIKARIKSENN